MWLPPGSNIHTQVLATGTWLSLYRQAAKPRLVQPIWYLHWIVRSLSSCYLELVFPSTMQSRTKRLLISRLIFLSMKYTTESFGLFISFSRIHSMNYWHTVTTFICLYISPGGEYSCLQAALVHAGYIYYLDFDSFFWSTRCIYQFCHDK